MTEPFAWIMDEVVYRIFIAISPRFRRERKEHMDEVRAQDMRLYGKIDEMHKSRWLKP